MALEKKVIVLSFGLFLLENEGCRISNRNYVEINKAYREFSEGLRK